METVGGLTVEELTIPGEIRFPVDVGVVVDVFDVVVVVAGRNQFVKYDEKKIDLLTG